MRKGQIEEKQDKLLAELDDIRGAISQLIEEKNDMINFLSAISAQVEALRVVLAADFPSPIDEVRSFLQDPQD